MAKTSPAVASGENSIEIELKDPRLAAFLAWLVPGLGHFYQGRTGKGVLFFVCIVGTFYYGLYIGGGRVVYASTSAVVSRQFLERWQYICQVGVGLPALPALIQTIRVEGHNEPLFGDNFLRPPYQFPPGGMQLAALSRLIPTATPSSTPTNYRSGITTWENRLKSARCSR